MGFSGIPTGGFDSADASSGVTVVAAPGAGNKIIVHKSYLSSDTACKISVSAGSSEDAKFHQHVAASGGSVVVPGGSELIVDGDANTALTVTSDSAAAVAGKLWYQIVPA